MVGKTRRRIKYMTVDSLHASFNNIDGKIRHMIEKGCTDKALEECIRRLWSQQFHQSLSKPALAGMIVHYRALYKGSRKTKKNKNQKGGVAPLEYTIGQGLTESYGRFPVFEGGSRQFVNDLGVINRTFESSIGAACDRTQKGGRKSRKQRGGADIFDTLSSLATGAGVGAAVRMGHAAPSVPVNVLQNVVAAGQGSPIKGTNGDPTAAGWVPATFDLKPFDASNAVNFELSPVYKGY